MGGVVTRSNVDTGLSYGAYREDLRRDFVYSCAYCSVTEIEARGFGFEIDHYQPVAHGGTDAYGNLYWSCRYCNRRKDSYWPSPAGHAAGKTVVRVDIEDPADHFEISDASEADATEVTHKTPTGQCTIELLELNSPRLKRIRALRKRFLQSRTAIAHGIRRLATARSDQLPADLRVDILRLRTEFESTSDLLNESIYNLVARASHSELIDPDPDEAERTAQRRRFLTDAGALPRRPKRTGRQS